MPYIPIIITIINIIESFNLCDVKLIVEILKDSTARYKIIGYNPIFSILLDLVLKNYLKTENSETNLDKYFSKYSLATQRRFHLQDSMCHA